MKQIPSAAVSSLYYLRVKAYAIGRDLHFNLLSLKYQQKRRKLPAQSIHHPSNPAVYGATMCTSPAGGLGCSTCPYRMAVYCR